MNKEIEFIKINGEVCYPDNYEVKLFTNNQEIEFKKLHVTKFEKKYFLDKEKMKEYGFIKIAKELNVTKEAVYFVRDNGITKNHRNFEYYKKFFKKDNKN